MNLRRVAAVVLSLPSAAYALLRWPAPAGHSRCGLMTSSAWEGWWHEDLASAVDRQSGQA